MSQWTHVAGHIQLDCFEGIGNPDYYHNGHEEFVKVAFGKIETTQEKIGNRTYTFHSSDVVPSGSEGPLGYDIKVTGEQDEGGGPINWGYITIWGDLRDYDDVQEIYKWIKDSCNKSVIHVRNCAVLISVEFQGQWLVYNTNDDEIKLKQIEKYKKGK